MACTETDCPLLKNGVNKCTRHGVYAIGWLKGTVDAGKIAARVVGYPAVGLVHMARRTAGLWAESQLKKQED